MSYREIRTPADERHLLTQIIRLNTEVRKKKERDRLHSLRRNAEYEKIFNPITKTMQSLLAPQAAAGDGELSTFSGSLRPPPPEIQVTDDVGVREEEEEEEEDLASPRGSRGRTRAKSKSRRATTKLSRLSREETAAATAATAPLTIKKSKKGPVRGSIYSQVAATITPQRREKGELGLRSDGLIAGYQYDIKGDVLTVHTNPPQTFPIHDPEVWRLLLLHNPSSPSGSSGSRANTAGNSSSGKNPSSLESYRQIILKILGSQDQQQDHHNVAGHTSKKGGPSVGGASRRGSSNYDLRQRQVNKNRKKFKLITGKGVKGPRRGGGGRGGFLFSTEGPPGSSKNPTRSRSRSESVKSGSSTRTIVIPRANRELLRELTLSLSELRAGNEGEREMCVQLSREARRRGILPRHLLSKEEMLWSSYK